MPNPESFTISPLSRAIRFVPDASVSVVAPSAYSATRAADIVVFDPVTVRATATYDEPRSYPIGIHHVVVNGTLVVEGGVHTGATPGRGIRLGRD